MFVLHAVAEVRVVVVARRTADPAVLFVLIENGQAILFVSRDAVPVLNRKDEVVSAGHVDATLNGEALRIFVEANVQALRDISIKELAADALVGLEGEFDIFLNGSAFDRRVQETIGLEAGVINLVVLKRDEADFFISLQTGVGLRGEGEAPLAFELRSSEEESF